MFNSKSFRIIFTLILGILLFISQSACIPGKTTGDQPGDIDLNTAIAVLKTATAQNHASSSVRGSITQTISSSPEVPSEIAPNPPGTPTQMTIQEAGKQLIATMGVEIPQVTPLPTAWGPRAIISASMPTVTPCISMGGNGCVWRFDITFLSNNNIGGKLQQVWTFFISKNGKRYVRNITGLSPADTVIPAVGTATYTDTFIDMFNTTVDLRGGKILLTYEGVDDNGNLFRGDASTRLASK